MRREFKVGQRVRFLHEKQEGIVQEILGPNTLLVLVDDFLDLEVHVKDVVHIHSEEQFFKEAAAQEDAGTKAPEPELMGTPSLGLFKNETHEYEFWITNPSSYELLVAIFLKIRHKFLPLNSAAIAPGDKFFVQKLSSQDFHQGQMIYLQVLRFPKGKDTKPVAPFITEIRFKTEILARKAAYLQAFDCDGWEFPLEEVPELPADLGEKSEAIRVKSSQPPSPAVVDLHIHKIMDNPLGIGADAMLLLQVETFEQKVSEAHMDGAPYIVFIHGVGTGKLKKAITDRLRGYDFVSRFEPADPVRYGNGATIVYF